MVIFVKNILSEFSYYYNFILQKYSKYAQLRCKMLETFQIPFITLFSLDKNTIVQYFC